MSILVITEGLSNTSTLWMRRQLDMISDCVTYLVTDKKSAKFYKTIYNVIVERESNNRIANRLLHFINYIRLFFAIHSKNVDVIFIHYATVAVKYNKLFATTRKNIVVHCHGYDVTWCNPSHGKRYQEQLKCLPQNVSFIANSCKTKQRLVDIGIDSSRITVKYLGINVPDQSKDDKDTPKDEQTILYLGRLIDFKGPDLVIRAFEEACDNGLGGKLIIAGDGPLRPTCELLRAHSPYANRIELIGAVDENTGQKLRDKADIFTAHNCRGPLSGQEEAFGVTIIEAMASGLPIVNTFSGSIPELIEDEVNGILVQPGDIKAHAHALIRVQNDTEFRKKLVKNGRERVQKCFSLEKEQRSLREILNVKNDSSITSQKKRKCAETRDLHY